MFKLLSLLLICISTSTAVTYFPDSAIVVASDVPPGTYINIPVSALTYYRVYATITTQTQTGFDSYVQIKDSLGSTTYLSTLANSVTNRCQNWFKAYGPSINITNNNNVGSTQYAFTIYIASSYWAEYPVISSGKVNGRIQSNSGLSVYGDGVTVINAEPFFNLYSFDIGKLSALTIGTNGYDANTNDYQVMKIDDPSRAAGSILKIASPISTLFRNSAKRTDAFSFVMDRTPASSYNVGNRGFVSILSPGWLDYGHTFTTDWQQTNTNTTIDFGTDNYLNLNLQLGEIYSQESLNLQVRVNGGGVTYNTTYTYQTKDQPQSYGRVVSVSTSSTNYNHVPRFLLQIR